MRILMIKNYCDYKFGDVLSFVSWRNEKDRSISGKIGSMSAEFVNFPHGTFRRLDVFKASYKVNVSNLGLPSDLEDDLMCHLEVGNDTLHRWDSSDFNSFERREEVNQYLEDAGISLDSEIVLSFSW